jgi:hypothetical protein
MKTPTMRTALVLSVASLLSVPLVGCDKKETQRDPEDESATDGGKGKPKPSKAATDEPDLAQAMENVAADRTPALGAAPGGPPPSGIFAPGEADKAAAKGSAATFTLGGDGSEPRVLLGPGPKPGTKRSGSVDIATQSDPQQGAIPIQFTVTVEAQKPKAEGDAGAALTTVLTKVTGAKINAPGVPADLSAAVGKLKGSSVLYQVGADGAANNAHAEISKGVDPGFRDPVQALSDLLVGLALPYPTKPVGVGAFWMVTTRDVLMGLDVVSYRLVKVEKVEGNVVSLSLNTKRYAASPAFELEGLPPDAPKTMAEFRAQSEGKLTVTSGEPFPKSCEVQSLIAAALGPADSKQRAMVQVQTRASLTLAP